MTWEPPLSEPAIPLVDLVAATERQRAEIDQAITEVVASGRYVSGARVAHFEARFADYCGSRRAVGVASGTAALHLALCALGIGRGDSVVTVSHTFQATAEAVAQTGARVVFVDVDPDTATMDPVTMRSVVAGARAVVPVHLYGQPADMASILGIAAEAGASVVEDAAQAHGALVSLREGSTPTRAGSMGVLGAFSCYPAKNLGALGDAGVVVTDDPELAECVARLRDHGRTSKYEHGRPGYGERLDEIQAAVLAVKLSGLDAANGARERVAARYDEALSGVGDLVLPPRTADRTTVWHLYVVRTALRDALLLYLKGQGIECGVHYPLPLHLQPAWRHLGYAPGDLPVTEAWARHCLSLPMYPELSPAQQDRVISAVQTFYRKHC